MAPYESPQIVELGSLAEVTRANAIGDFLDADFPVNTPVPDLTFTN